jgi:hypothetical protein
MGCAEAAPPSNNTAEEDMAKKRQAFAQQNIRAVLVPQIFHRTSDSFPGNNVLRRCVFVGREKEARMRKLALGVIAAGTLLTAAVPAMAQIGFYAGPFGVGVGGPYRGNQSYGGYYYDAPRAYSYYDAPRVYDYYEAPPVYVPADPSPAYVAPGWR